MKMLLMIGVKDLYQVARPRRPRDVMGSWPVRELGAARRGSIGGEGRPPGP